MVTQCRQFYGDRSARYVADELRKFTRPDEIRVNFHARFTSRERAYERIYDRVESADILMRESRGYRRLIFAQP